jgi:Retrotransposon gag protein
MNDTSDFHALIQSLNIQINQLAADNQDIRARLQENLHAPRAPEPKLVLPEKFSGRHNELRNFISSVQNTFDLQPSRFHSDRVKTGFIGSLCHGDALTWYRSLQETDSALLYNYHNFIDEFKAYFGDPYFQENARRNLLQLSQGRTSASNYTAKFRRLAADTSFNDETLRYHYERGLSPNVQRAIAVNDKSFANVEELMKYAIKVDNRLFEFSRHGVILPNPSASDGPVPMEIGSIATRRPGNSPRAPGYNDQRQKLSTTEKDRRRTLGLCHYCGIAGHFSKSCPAKSSSSRISSIDVPDPKNASVHVPREATH